MTPQELKNSILQLAIQGKLVEQRPEEGTAEELYRQIQAEKQALIKAGKLKKEKPLPEITEDEIPFEIPESWKWVRIANTWAVLNGDRGKNYPAKSTLSHKGIPFISALNLDGKTVINDDNLLCLSEAQYDKLGNGKLQQGDVVVCIRGSLGKHGRFPFEKGAIASSLVIMRSQLVLPILDDFLMLYLDAPLFFSEIKKYDNGTAQPNLAAKSFEQFLFPLPPLVEQKRIVAKIEELLPLIERYEKAWSRLEDFNKRFPGDMQKSILQMAIQGKLVEQRPEEGTGEELYHQIQAEKQALIRTGKIKKDRRTDNLDIPQEDELPFDIPETWKWVYLGSVLNKLTDGTHRTPKYSTSGVKFVSVKDMSSGVLLLNNTKFITESEHKELFARCDPVKGDMLLSKVGTTGVPAIVDTDEPFSLFVSVALLKYSHNCLDEGFLYYLLKSPLVQLQAAENTRGVGNKNWVLDAIAKTVIVLPPIAEQKRIVARLEELLPLCEKLK